MKMLECEDNYSTKTEGKVQQNDMTDESSAISWISSGLMLEMDKADLTPLPPILLQPDSNTPDGSKQLPSTPPSVRLPLIHRTYFHLDETEGNHVFDSMSL